MASYRKKQAQARPFFLLSCEGVSTEVHYFQMLKSRLNGQVEISIIQRPAGNSSPKDVEWFTLIELGKLIQYQSITHAQVWLIMDVDHWLNNNHIINLREVVRDAQSRDWQVALSNPRFEVWLHFHFEPIPADELDWSKLKQIVDHFRKDHKQRGWDNLFDLIPTAVQHANDALANGKDVWNDKGTTQVHLLIRQLLPEG
jgi:hypothetical protein